MPLGKTHDAVTFFLTAPVWAGIWYYTEHVPLATIVTSAFLFGGLMFGPDLDTRSTQYTRWGFLKNLWFPYQQFFKHRSRWSHGLILGTLIRVIYFIGVLTLLSFLITFVYSTYIGGTVPDLFEFTKNWQQIGKFISVTFGEFAIYAIFAGLWLGAASHTLADIIGTFLKTGKISEFM